MGSGVDFSSRTIPVTLHSLSLEEQGFTNSGSRLLLEGGREVAHLTSLRLAGWKSIRDAKIELRPLNVLIGANGAGKSNLVSFFKLINEMMGRRLQIHVGTTGGAESLLHYGSKRTKVIEAEFRIATDKGQTGTLSVWSQWPGTR